MMEWFRKLFGPYGPETKKVQLTFFLGSWAILAAIGLFIPEKALSENEWAWRFSDFMASFIPQIDRVTALNLRPEVNRLHYSILWAVSPVYFVVTLNGMFNTAAIDSKRTTYGQTFGAILVCIWLIGWTMFLWWGLGSVDDSHNRITRTMFYHPLSRAVYAPLTVYVFWGSVAAIIYLVWGFITGRYHSAKRSETRG